MNLLRRGLLLGTGLALLLSQVGRGQTPDISEQVDALLRKLRPARAGGDILKADVRSDKVDLYGDPLPHGAHMRLGTVRFRHGSVVSSVRYSADGKTLLSVGQDLTIRVWEASSGKEKQHYALGTSAGLGQVAFLALSTDARLIAAVDGNNAIRVTDLATDKVLWQTKDPTRRLSFPAFSPDGKVLAVLVVDDNNNDGLIRLWDTSNGKVVRDLVGKAKGENQQAFFPVGFAFSANGKVLVALGNDNVNGGGNAFHLWDVASGKELPKPEKLVATNGVVALSPDCKHLAAVTQDTNVFKMLLGNGGSALCLWDAATGKLVRRLGENQTQVTGLLFSPNGKTLAVFENNQEIHLWDVASGKELPAPPSAGNNQQLGGLAFSPDGKLLAVSGSNVGKIIISEVASGKQVHELKGFQFDGNNMPPGQIGNGQMFDGTSLAFSADGKRLAAAAHLIRQWEIGTGKEIIPVQAGHEGEVRSVAFAPDGKRIATGGGDNTVRIWDRASGKELLKLTAPDPEVPQDNDLPSVASALAFTPDGKQLLIGWDDGPIQLCDLATGKEVRQYKGHEFGVTSLAVASGGRVFASGGEDGRAFWWDLATGKQLRQFAGPIGVDPNPNNPPSGLDMPTAVALSPDGRMVAVLNSDQLDLRIQLLELSSGKVRKQFKLRGIVGPFDQPRGGRAGLGGGRLVRGVLDGVDPGLGGSMQLAFSPDGKLLAWGNGTTIRLWDLMAGKEIRQFGGQEESIQGMSFAPDGKKLLAASSDGTIRVWEVATGTILGDIRGHRGGVASLAFAPDGLVLATGGSDTTALLWDLKAALADEQPRAGIPNAAEIDQLWTGLADEDGVKADAAIDRLASAPAPAVALIRDRLKPTPAIDGPRIDRLLADLENDQFDVRKQAAEALEKLGELAEARLRKRLADNPSLDLKMRIEQLMEKLAGPVTVPEQIQGERAVEVLERIGTAEARGLLESLAEGAPEARLTQAAAGALGRLKK